MKKEEARMSNYQRFCADVRKRDVCPALIPYCTVCICVALLYNLCCIHIKKLWDPQHAKERKNNFIACM